MFRRLQYSLISILKLEQSSFQCKSNHGKPSQGPETDLGPGSRDSSSFRFSFSSGSAWIEHCWTLACYTLNDNCSLPSLFDPVSVAWLCLVHIAWLYMYMLTQLMQLFFIWAKIWGVQGAVHKWHNNFLVGVQTPRPPYHRKSSF